MGWVIFIAVSLAAAAIVFVCLIASGDEWQNKD